MTVRRYFCWGSTFLFGGEGVGKSFGDLLLGEAMESEGKHAIPINIKNDFSLINQIYFNIIGHMQIWLHQLDGTAQAVTL